MYTLSFIKLMQLSNIEHITAFQNGSHIMVESKTIDADGGFWRRKHNMMQNYFVVLKDSTETL